MKQEKAQHTQGPWGYEMAKEMLRPFDSGIDTNHPESEANARLIAAAPLLLEALKIQTAKITRYFETPPSKRGYFEAVDFNKEATAAIAATQS